MTNSYRYWDKIVVAQVERNIARIMVEIGATATSVVQEAPKLCIPLWRHHEATNTENTENCTIVCQWNVKQLEPEKNITGNIMWFALMF